MQNVHRGAAVVLLLARPVQHFHKNRTGSGGMGDTGAQPASMAASPQLPHREQARMPQQPSSTPFPRDQDCSRKHCCHSSSSKCCTQGRGSPAPTPRGLWPLTQAPPAPLPRAQRYSTHGVAQRRICPRNADPPEDDNTLTARQREIALGCESKGGRFKAKHKRRIPSRES